MQPTLAIEKYPADPFISLSRNYAMAQVRWEVRTKIFIFIPHLLIRWYTWNDHAAFYDDVETLSLVHSSLCSKSYLVGKLKYRWKTAIWENEIHVISFFLSCCFFNFLFRLKSTSLKRIIYSFLSSFKVEHRNLWLQSDFAYEIATYIFLITIDWHRNTGEKKCPSIWSLQLICR